jgi:hypothetical protein
LLQFAGVEVFASQPRFCQLIPSSFLFRFSDSLSASVSGFFKNPNQIQKNGQSEGSLPDSDSSKLLTVKATIPDPPLA